MPRQLSTRAARRFYDRFGARQDKQGYYEDAALDRLIDQGGFETAKHVFEFGCGTGRLAERLLDHALPATARYDACDLSATMVALAQSRTERFGDRVRVWQSPGGGDFSAQGAFDRIVSTYVLDLMSPEDIRAFLDYAGRALCPGGLLCLVSLTWGAGNLAALTSRLWTLAHRIRPELVGGCRPVRLAPMLDPSIWLLRHDSQVAPWSIASEIAVAERL